MQTVRVMIGVGVLCLVVRTFIVLGLVTPVVVVGDSMATRLAAGKQIAVDRASLAWWPLRRWERVVTQHPEDARLLVVKRVIGLPRERVELRNGDVWIDGTLVRKNIAEQRAVRVLVHRENRSTSRWAADSDHAVPAGTAWRIDGRAEPQAIAYHHPGDGVIHDDLAMNESITRRLNPVADLMVTCDVMLLPGAACGIEIDVTGQRMELELTDAALRVHSPAGEARFALPPAAGRRREVTLSRFDGQFLAAVGEQPYGMAPLPPLAADIRVPQAIRVRVSGGRAIVRDLTVWRDVHYEHRPFDRVPAPSGSQLGGSQLGGWRLAAKRWFLVGDNQAVSLDCRNWQTGPPGVPERLIMGRLAKGPIGSK